MEKNQKKSNDTADYYGSGMINGRINKKLHKKERMEDLQNYGGRNFRKGCGIT